MPIRASSASPNRCPRRLEMRTPRNMRRFLAALLGSLFRAGCSLAPSYQAAPAEVPPAFKEMAAMTPEQAGSWKQAEPAEGTPRGEWWKVFGDSQLDDYETQALAANQDLKAAAARLQ